MALAPTVALDSESPGSADSVKSLRLFVFALFFIFGGITSLNDIIIPKLRALFTLTHANAMLVQSAFFLAYALFSIPAAAVVRKLGYMRTASVGLLMMTAGCLLFLPASRYATFPLFLFALFVLGAGITVVQVVANPLISLLGASSTAHSRLTFAQAFNSLGTTLFPLAGSALILGDLAHVDHVALNGTALETYRQEASAVVVHTYLGLAFALAVVAAVVWTQRNKLARRNGPSGSLFNAFTLLRRARFAFGTACIFLYVGAEVALGSMIVDYLMQSNVLGISAQAAGNHVPIYWGGALVGRFIGAVILRHVAAGKVLMTVALCAVLLSLISATGSGAVAAWSLLAIGLTNSVMFPSIFSLASEGLDDRAADGSGVIATAIVGGAVIPFLVGMFADLTGDLSAALILPALCYAVIAGFGYFTRRKVVVSSAATA
jgi:FHS family L-fucose permease-like MFS transporter